MDASLLKIQETLREFVKAVGETNEEIDPKEGYEAIKAIVPELDSRALYDANLITILALRCKAEEINEAARQNQTPT